MPLQLDSASVRLGVFSGPLALPSSSQQVPSGLSMSSTPRWELITRYSLPLWGRSWLSPAPSLGFLRHTPDTSCLEYPFCKGRKISSSSCSFPFLVTDSHTALPCAAERSPPSAKQALTCSVPHCAHSGNADAETCSCLKFVPNQTLFSVSVIMKYKYPKWLIRLRRETYSSLNHS